jgi:hypothetical protein
VLVLRREHRAAAHHFGVADEGATLAMLAVAQLLQTYCALVLAPTGLLVCATSSLGALLLFVGGAAGLRAEWAVQGCVLLAVFLATGVAQAWRRERGMRGHFLDRQQMEEDLMRTRRHNVLLKRHMSRLSTFYAPLLKARLLRTAHPSNSRGWARRAARHPPCPARRPPWPRRRRRASRSRRQRHRGRG